MATDVGHVCLRFFQIKARFADFFFNFPTFLLIKYVQVQLKGTSFVGI